MLIVILNTGLVYSEKVVGSREVTCVDPVQNCDVESDGK